MERTENTLWFYIEVLGAIKGGCQLVLLLLFTLAAFFCIYLITKSYYVYQWFYVITGRQPVHNGEVNPHY